MGSRVGNLVGTGVLGTAVGGVIEGKADIVGSPVGAFVGSIVGLLEVLAICLETFAIVVLGELNKLAGAGDGSTWPRAKKHCVLRIQIIENRQRRDSCHTNTLDCRDIEVACSF